MHPFIHQRDNYSRDIGVPKDSELCMNMHVTFAHALNCNSSIVACVQLAKYLQTWNLQACTCKDVPHDLGNRKSGCHSYDAQNAHNYLIFI